MVLKIKKGLRIPLAGEPEQRIYDAAETQTVALLGSDYPGLKPRMLVGEGDRVRLGQALFADKRIPGVSFASPGSGLVQAINRGARRSLQSVVIRLEGNGEERFERYARDALSNLGRSELKANLLASGLWTALRTRPFSQVPAPESEPHSIFVPVLDTNPLAPRPEVIIAAAAEDFSAGLDAVAGLTDGLVHVCKGAGVSIPVHDHGRIQVTEVAGPHPAGLVGTHIHFLDPIGAGGKTVWHLNYQDVIAIGRLFTTGRLDTGRVIALAGPMVSRPRLIRTRLGAQIGPLVEGELESSPCRVISGSILSGHRTLAPLNFLGRYDLQISVVNEGGEREFLGWLAPGANRFSAINVFLASLLRKRSFHLSTSQNGSPRAMVPIGGFERVMPLDILATPLLKALLVRDTETARALGCLELDEEDLALCTFVCCSKYEYGPVLRENLTQIHREGL